MKQFGKILTFELKHYLKNKVFVGVTLVMVAVLAIVMFFPRISALLATEEGDHPQQEAPVMLVKPHESLPEELIRQGGKMYLQPMQRPFGSGIASSASAMRCVFFNVR